MVWEKSIDSFSINLYDWTVTKSWEQSKIGCYSTNVTWSDDTVSTFFRRERPEIMFDTDGNPLYFYSAVQEFKNDSHFGYSYSVVQQLG